MIVGVAITCFNRPSTTKRCIDSLSMALDGLEWHAFIADASTDMALSSEDLGDSRVSLVPVPSDYYWTWGTCAAMAAVSGWFQETSTPEDEQLWLILNDDVVLDPVAFQEFLEWFDSKPPTCIGSGCVTDPRSGQVTYGPKIRRRGLRLRFDFPADVGLTEIVGDTANGNVLLLRGSTIGKLGFPDQRFRHSMADLDYGLRATDEGYQIMSPALTVGDCPPNPIAGRWMDTTIDFRKRLELRRQPTGLPLDEWARFCHRHAGRSWLLNSIIPILGLAIGSLREVLGFRR